MPASKTWRPKEAQKARYHTYTHTPIRVWDFIPISFLSLPSPLVSPSTTLPVCRRRHADNGMAWPRREWQPRARPRWLHADGGGVDGLAVAAMPDSAGGGAPEAKAAARARPRRRCANGGGVDGLTVVAMPDLAGVTTRNVVIYDKNFMTF